MTADRPITHGLRPGMPLVRKRLGLAFLPALVLALVLSGPARAQFILFHNAVGDWSVTCWRDLVGEERSCRVSAPKAALGAQFAPNVIEVREWSSGRFQVIVSVRDRVMPGMPLTLRVDGLALHETTIRADGKAWWSDEEAAKIILEMQAGRKVVYRVQTLPDGMPRDMRVSLVPFKRAFQIYRSVLRSHAGLVD
ncbi:MAG: hypothetical protein HQ514_13510 [Rhodospirillales bacterium]|nr:hypothetical protein [Rhodospirillales bacterium]